MTHSEGVLVEERRRRVLAPSEWAEWVERWRCSGLSRRSFCRHHGLALATFCRKVKAALGGESSRREISLPSVESGGWLEVRLSSSGAPGGVESEESLGSGFEVVLGGRRRVRLGPQFDAAGLCRLITVLESLPC